jgi:GLPGLI family protein
MRKTFTLILFSLFFLGASAQDSFEGQVFYKVTYSSQDEKLEEMSSMLPKKSKLTVRGEKAVFEQATAGGGRQAIYSNSETKESILLMSVLGTQYKVNISPEDLKTIRQTESLEIIELNEGKTIEGYWCEKALAISEGDTLTVFYTPKIRTSANFPPFSKIDGLPLEYELVRGNIRMQYTVVNIIEKRIDPEFFEIDPSINEIKFEDFARTFAIEQ